MSLLVMVSAGALAPKLIGRFGAARVLAGGSLVMAGGLLVWAYAATTGSYADGILPALLATAPGVGLAVVGGTVAATTGVREEQSGLASGLVNMTQQIGAAIGLAILVAASSSRTSNALAGGSSPTDALTDGYAAAFTLGAAFAAGAAALTAVLLVRRNLTPRPVAAAAEGAA
jgi:MFS family permease